MSLLKSVKTAVQKTVKAAKAVDHACKGNKCYACGALGSVGHVDGKSYGKACGHWQKMDQSGATTVKRAVRRDGHAGAALGRRGKAGGPTARGRHNA